MLPRVFDDRLLSDTIARDATERGECDYCRSADVALIDPPELADLFAPLKSIYQPNPDGRLLADWLRDDWGMFDNPTMDIHARSALLAAIFDDAQLITTTFDPTSRYTSNAVAQWEDLRTELMTRNRYFPDAPLDADRLKNLLGNLLDNDVTMTWYRARLQQHSDPYGIAEMGVPPARIASHGRANPPGIPYLYLGSTAETAISEIRPHTGETACVARFTITDDLKLVDLRNPKKRVSPFVYGDEDSIGALRTDVPFLDLLGEELTRPVLPQGAAIDYVPSQYLCEMIKKLGYDGVIYRSSVSEGINLALFDPGRATGHEVVQRYVRRVAVEID